MGELTCPSPNVSPWFFSLRTSARCCQGDAARDGTLIELVTKILGWCLRAWKICVGCVDCQANVGLPWASYESEQPFKQLLLLMEEILHQLIGSLSHYFWILYIAGGAGFLPSTAELDESSESIRR